MPLSPGRASSHPSPSSSHRDAQLHPASVPAFLPPRAAALAAPGGSHYRPCPPGVAGKGLGSIPGSARPLPRRGLIGQLSPNGKQMEPGGYPGKTCHFPAGTWLSFPPCSGMCQGMPRAGEWDRSATRALQTCCCSLLESCRCPRALPSSLFPFQEHPSGDAGAGSSRLSPHLPRRLSASKSQRLNGIRGLIWSHKSHEIQS